jgi:hypothetical protein
MIGVVLAFVLLFVGLARAATTTVTLVWDPNVETDLAGYKLYQAPATTGPWTLRQTLLKVVTTTVAGLPDGNVCWSLTAYDVSQNESGRSNVVCLQLDSSAPTTPAALDIRSLVRVP